MSDTSTHATTHTHPHKTHRWARKQGSVFIGKKVLVSKRTLKISGWLTRVTQSQICDYFQALAEKHSEMLERLSVAPGQLKMSSIFPVLLFSTSRSDCFLLGQTDTSVKCLHSVTRGYSVDVQALDTKGQTHTGL